MMVWNVFTVAVILVILGAAIQYSAQAILLSSVDSDLEAWDRSFASVPKPGGPPPPRREFRRGPDLGFMFDHGPPNGGPPPGGPPPDRPPGDEPRGGPHFRPMNEKALSES